MKFTILIFTASLAFASAAIAAEPFSLKGVALGAPADKAQITQALNFTCAPDGCAWPLRCVGASCGTGSANIAGASADVFIVVDHQQVQEIDAQFSALKFADVETAFAAKYGKPSSVDRSHAQTIGGAQLDVIVETWKAPSGDTITLVNHADAAHATLTMQTAGEIKLRADLKAKRGAI